MHLTFLAKDFNQRDSVTICKVRCKLPLAKLPFVTEEDKLKTAKLYKAVIVDGNVEFTCHGVAKCHVEDAEKFDYTLGRHIAESKAKHKAYSKAERILKHYVNILLPTVDELSNSGERLGKLSDYELTHVKELMK